MFLLSVSSIASAIQSKGAIIIASLEGEVTVTNNLTGVSLPGDRIKTGGLIFDGHTVKTGAGSKVVLLFSSGTITTLQADSVLNIKKFAQEKFDPKNTGKLSDRADEPSPSETIIDLNLGDMVVDVKKLKKESSFNIDSPVGTAGIRGTVPAISVQETPGGGFNQTTNMLRGSIEFMPKGGGPATFLGPGQSLKIGIGPGGVIIPAVIGRVDPTVLNSIQGIVDKASKASGGSASETENKNAPAPNLEEDAPSEDEINETDDSRQASAKGVDDNGSEAVALEKAGLIDLDNPDQAGKVKTYVEVTNKGAEVFKQINDRDGDGTSDEVDNFPDDPARRVGRRALTDDERNNFEDQINQADSLAALDTIISSIGSGEDELVALAKTKKRQIFSSNVGLNLDNVVEVADQAEQLNLKSDDNLVGFLNNAEQSGDLVEVLRTPMT